MSITAIILAHFRERVDNLSLIVEDLLSGTVKPDKIIIFVDNPEICLDEYEDDRVTIIKSDHSFKPNIRFALGTVCETDYCFFIDDDLTVSNETLENFVKYTAANTLLGLEGSQLGQTPTPYANDTPIRHPKEVTPVDIIIRSYFVPTPLLLAGLGLRLKHPELPKESLDDVFLSLGNKYLNGKQNLVIPHDDESGLIELSEGGVGQSRQGEHYNNRNIVCRKLMDIYGR